MNEFDRLPIISIVTPSYNQAKYLERTILSVLSQNYPKTEYIIMDGNSTDGSIEIIRKYSDQLSYWVSQPDKGQADAINRGFDHASGQIYSWLNSDDTYEPNTLRTIARIFNADPNVRFVYGEGWYIDEEDKRIRPCKFVRHTFPYNYLVNKDPILQQAAFWRSDLWTETGILDINLNWVFDWDWFIRAYQNTNFYYNPQFLSNYRVHSDAKTRSGNIKRRYEQAYITKKYGSWWHPNHLTQQFRIFDHNIQNITRSWPKSLQKIIRFFSSTSRKIAESAFYGRYSS